MNDDTLCLHRNTVPWVMSGRFETRKVRLCQDCGATLEAEAECKPAAPPAQGLGALMKRLTGSGR